MSVPQIRLKTKDFRAIANADIIIDGITVVAGENGSGKSTLSKLLYFVFKTACNYEKLVEEELREDLKDVERFLDAVIVEFFSFSDDKYRPTISFTEKLNRKNKVNSLINELKSIKKIKNILKEEVKQRWHMLISNIKEAHIEIATFFEDSVIFEFRKRRFFHISDVLLGEEVEENNFGNEVYDKVGRLVDDYYEKAFEKINNRPLNLFEKAISNIFNGNIGSFNIEVSEFNEPIIKTGDGTMLKPFTILNTIYTDTPMSIGVNDSGFQYWDDLNALLRQKNKVSNPYSKIISNEIINGEAALNIDSLSGDDYTFKRSDGAVFNLLDCATGIKSFAMLQILLNNGSLNDKTLLIIDEPEVHLHPKWIVEYARIIVMLNKEMGVKFFIASHDPDFISAIRYISEKEGNLDKVNFYLAEKAGETFTYNYTHLQHNIDPIFKSFNIAISKIEEYGA